MWLRPDKGGEIEASFVKRALRLRANQRALDAPRWDSRKGRMHLRRIVNGIDEPRNRSSQRWYTPREMKRLVERVGLKIENIYGSYLANLFIEVVRR